MTARLSMIVHNLDLFRPLIAPPKYDPPLIVYSDRMLAGDVASKSFQSVALRRHEIAKQPLEEVWIASAYARERFGGLLPGVARAASVDGSSLSLLAMTAKSVIGPEIVKL